MLPAQDDAIWLGNSDPDRTLKLDLASNVFIAWQLPPDDKLFPEGMVAANYGNLWWAAPFAGVVVRLEPAVNRVTQYALPAGFVPEMITFSRGSVWYTEVGRGTIGVLNATTASGVTLAVARTTDGVAPTFSSLGAGTTTSASASAGVASWTSEAMTLVTDGDGWTVYGLPSGAAPWAITVSDGRMWFVDRGRQVSGWLCYWADLDCGCSVDAQDLTIAARNCAHWLEGQQFSM